MTVQPTLNLFEHLVQDVQIIILRLLDLSSMRNILIAFPRTQTLLQINPKGTIKTIIRNMYPFSDEEMYSYLMTVVGMRQNSEDFDTFHRLRMYDDDLAIFGQDTRQNLNAIEQMIGILEAVDYLLLIIMRGFDEGINTLQQFRQYFLRGHPQRRSINSVLRRILPVAAPTISNTYRIILALLRLQLFCQLFHGPRHDNRIRSDEERETRSNFWIHFDVIEVEEVSCVINILRDAVEKSGDVEYIDGGEGPRFEVGLPHFHRHLDLRAPLLTKRGKVYIHMCLDYFFPEWDSTITDWGSMTTRWNTQTTHFAGANLWQYIKLYVSPNTSGYRFTDGRFEVYHLLLTYFRNGGWTFWEDKNAESWFDAKYMKLIPPNVPL